MGLCPLLRSLCFSLRYDTLLHLLSTQVLPHPFRDESPWGCLGRKLVASLGLPHLGSVLYVSAGTGGCGSVCPWAAGCLMHLTGLQAISCTCVPCRDSRSAHCSQCWTLEFNYKLRTPAHLPSSNLRQGFSQTISGQRVKPVMSHTSCFPAEFFLWFPKYVNTNKLT